MLRNKREYDIIAVSADKANGKITLNVKFLEGKGMKKFFSILIALMLVMQAVSFGGAVTQKSNAAEAVCYLGNVSAKYGSDTVRVPIYLENNPGIISIQLEIYYPTDYFTLTDIDYNEECGLGTNIGSDVFSQHPFVFIMGKDTATSNCKFNGVIAELVLEVKDNAPAAGYDIEIINATAEGAIAMNANIATVEFTAKNGSIRLIEDATPTPVPTAAPTAPATGTVTGDPTETPSGTQTGEPGATNLPGATNVPGATNIPGTTNVPATTNAPGTTSAPGNDPTQSAGNTGAVPTGSTTDDTSSSGQPGNTTNPSPTNIPVTTATPAPETDGPSDSTLTPSTSDPGQTQEPSSDNPSGNATSAPGDSQGDDQKDDGEEDKKGCGNTAVALTVIIVCVVLCAAGITAVWITHKKKAK